MENDLISRKKAIDEANAWLLECLGVTKQNRSCGLIRRLEDLPPAQPIKCRECKHSAMIYHTNMIPVVGGFRAEGIDHIFCQCDKLGGIEMRWDDFCSRAERRGEQDE